MPEIGVVALAWRVDQADAVALERVTAHEESQALALAEMEDGQRILQQFVLADLEQLVARIVREHAVQRLRRVSAGLKARACDDVHHLAPEQRNLGRAKTVSRVGVETEEAVLAADFTALVVALDPDVVEVAWPMHRRARVRLGHQQEIPHPRIGAGLGWERGKARGRLFVIAAAQNAEARAGGDVQRIAVVGPCEVAGAKAEEGEVPGHQPAQEELGFLDLVEGQRRGLPLEVVDDVGGARQHGAPVRNGEPDVGEYPRDVSRQRFEGLRIGHTIDLQMHERLAHDVFGRRRRFEEFPSRIAAVGDDRVDDEMQGEAVTVHFHRHGVHQEGHVVVDDLDHGMRRLPAMVRDARVEDPHLGAAGLATTGERELRKRRSVGVCRFQIDQIVGVHLPVILGHEALDSWLLVGRNLGPQERLHGCQMLGLALFGQ